jgi:adenine-specific DNA-methyltransferase
MTQNNEKLTRFINLLEGIFELDKVDLDFGIYRIMNIRKDEIRQFLFNGLPKKVQETLAPFAADTSSITRRIAEIEKQAADLGIEISASPKLASEYAKLKNQLAAGVDLSSIETDVYSVLFGFFNRYYDEGDFISKRRYKEGVYAIPYEGEEVKLYWANADQYYIKTAENFRDYTFINNGKKIHFRLVGATTEKNNNKESDASKRVFMLYSETENKPGLKTIEEVGGELIIRFEYDVPTDKKAKYDDLNNAAITEAIGKQFKDWYHLLAPASHMKKEDRTILQKHLQAYVAKNTFDYFIHKDLRGFLTRELDFFIKSEVIHLDDIDTTDEKRVDSYLAKVRAIKRVGKSIIDFLAQIEDFQKKLWLKKKFVVAVNWCVTLDRIDESFYPEIIANDAQMVEWKEMYAIDEIEANILGIGYSGPLTADFLRQNGNLVLDTRHFTTDFKDRLVASIDNLDEQTGGLMIHSENFQALQLLTERYRSQIQCVYIDPPYNTVYSKILYKNNYEHASWLSLIKNTLPLVPQFWTDQFSFGLAIDDYEFVNLAQLLDQQYPSLERSTIVINHHPQGSGGRISRTHEYYIILSKPSSPSYLGEPLDDHNEDRSFMRSGTGENNYRQYRWKSFYALLLDPETNAFVGAEEPVPLGEPYPTEPTTEGYKRIYPVNSRGEERVWRSSYLTGRQRVQNNEIIITPQGSVKYTIEHTDDREVLFSNWTDSKFNAGTQGANLLRDMGLGGEFDYPKSIKTLETGLWAQSFGDTSVLTLDYFAGSGTTGHAVLNLNREDNGSRKYILVEMGEYFQTVTLPRMKKVIYAADWKNGKPQNRNAGVSHIMKYLTLESYEDALSNIELNDAMHRLYGLIGVDYMLHYMFNVEAKDSLLPLDAFNTPFSYQLKITENNEAKNKTVDLCETFNYLLGLSVIRQSAVARFKAIPDGCGEYENAVKLERDDSGNFGFRQIEGRLPDGKRALVIWRTVTQDLLQSNAALDAYFTRHRINPADREFDVIYVNGDNNLENLRLDDEDWKVQRIEPVFKAKMFEGAE